MWDHSTRQSWWKLVLIGFLAITFGISAVVLPGRIMFGRILDVIFGEAKPLSASMTAVVAPLALVALVGIDGLANLFGAGVIGKHASRVRGLIGIVTAIAAVFWPGKTAYFAVELIGVWAIAVGILELFFARYSGQDAKNRALLIVAAIASLALGAAVMKWPFAGAVVASALVGAAAMARGISLILSGFSERSHEVHGRPVVGGDAA
jgi:uncharacterized membrane protein HdeD (DUF308 family)